MSYAFDVMSRVRNLFAKTANTVAPLANEVLVQTSVGCEHCGSGVLKVDNKNLRLRCMQCAALDLPLTAEQARRFSKEHAWRPAQSSRYGL